MDSIRISVVIPAYNVKEYIEESLACVFSQTKKFYEVIVVDDGSTDGTTEILAKYAETQDLKHIYIENSGQGHARNVGMLASSGDYIYFFDSDDLLDVKFVEWVTQQIEVFEYPDVIFFAGKSFSTPGYSTEFMPDYARGFEVKNVSGEEALKHFNRSGKFASQPCLYVSKRSLWGRGKLEFKYASHEDEEILYPLILAARRVCVFDEIFFHRRVRPMSFMTSPQDSKKAYGCYVIMLSSVETFNKYSKAKPITKSIIRRRAAGFASKYVFLAKELDMPVDFKAVITCAIKIKSPYLFARALYNYQNKNVKKWIGLFLRPIFLATRR